MKVSRSFSLMAGCLLLAIPTTATAQVVYSNDFETSTTGFSSSSTDTLPTTSGGFASTPTSTFLGRFASGTVDLSLTGLTVGRQYRVGFDLFIGASWDGNSTAFGPDNWRLGVTGNSDLVNTTFINLVPADGALNDFTQNYSDSNPVGPGSNARFAGADVSFAGSSINDRYAIYKFSNGGGNPDLTFTATNANTTITFAGVGLQDTGDEFWAIDNVIVSGISAPEPSAFVLLLPILSILAAKRRRK